MAIADKDTEILIYSNEGYNHCEIAMVKNNRLIKISCETEGVINTLKEVAANLVVKFL